MMEFFESYDVSRNVWFGVTVENKKHGLPRINKLRQLKAYIRFLSIEPLLEDIGKLDLTNIQWVIVGGESGPKARPMKLEWKRISNTSAKSKMFSSFLSSGADGKQTKKTCKES